MGERYKQLGLDERCAIAGLYAAGRSIRQIAAALDRAPSSISREVKRNAGTTVGYKPSYAQEQASARRWCGSRLDRNQVLRATVLDRLAAGWSPEQSLPRTRSGVAGRLALDHGRRIISHESIYRFVHAQIRRTKNHAWRHYLPRAKARRGWRGRPGGSSALRIKDRTSIAQRGDADRATPGHWEGDTMLFATYGQLVLAAHERSSRVILIARPPSKHAVLIAKQLAQWLAPLPAGLKQTITFDNGTEFAEHHRLRQHGIATFFCDVRSPWQKGGVENAIGRLRRFLPRRTNLDDAPALVEKAAIAYNNTPRKCLGFKTPAETFQLLHFKCESTFPPARE